MLAGVRVILVALCLATPTWSIASTASFASDGTLRVAPDFTRTDLKGNTLSLRSYRGKLVLLNFWATWCGPCRVEIPWFIDIERKNKDKGFAVLGVSMDENGWEDVKPFLAEMKVNYRVVIGDDSTTEAYGGVESLPTTFLIDRQGKIAAIHLGLDAGRKEFEDGIQELLQETPGTHVTTIPGGVPVAAVAPKQ